MAVTAFLYFFCFCFDSWWYAVAFFLVFVVVGFPVAVAYGYFVYVRLASLAELWPSAYGFLFQILKGKREIRLEFESRKTISLNIFP